MVIPSTARTLGAIVRPDGTFSIEGLQPGAYTLRFTMIGYAIENSQPVTISAESPRVVLPQVRLTRQAVEVAAVDQADGGAVVIAEDRSGAHALQHGDDLVRLRAVSDGVAQDPDLLDVGQVVGHCLQGSQIGVDVREDEVLHLFFAVLRAGAAMVKAASAIRCASSSAAARDESTVMSAIR